mgnify:CR=1 FL=1
MDTFFELGDYDRAIQAANDLIQLDPSNHEWYMDLSTAYQQNGQAQDAIRAMELSFKISPTLPEKSVDATRYGTLGECYASMGQHSMALKNLNQCISLLGDDAGYQIYLLRAEIYGNLGKNKEKHEDMLRAMGIEPEKEDAHRDFMWHLHMFSQFNNLLQSSANSRENARKTLYHLDECLSLNLDGSFALYLTRAAIHMTQGEFEKADKDLNKLAAYLERVDKSGESRANDEQLALDRVRSRLLVARVQLNLAQHLYREANEALSDLMNQPRYCSLLSEEENESLNRMKLDIERNLQQL